MSASLSYHTDRHGRLIKRYRVARDRGWVGPIGNTAGLLNQLFVDQEHGIVGMSARVHVNPGVEPSVANQGHCHGFFHIRINGPTDPDNDLPNVTKTFIRVRTSYRYSGSDWQNMRIDQEVYSQRFRYPVIFRRDNVQITGNPTFRPRMRIHVDCANHTGGFVDEIIDLDGDGQLDGDATTFAEDWRVEWHVDIASGPGWNRTGGLAGTNGGDFGGTSEGIDH